jgi:large subunit ribosomal protein L6
MSRIAKQPVIVPDSVTVTVGNGEVTAKGPKGELSLHVPTNRVKIAIADGQAQVSAKSDLPEDRAASGLARNLIANLVTGVTDGFTKALEFSGVGYRAEVSGKTLKMALGYSHPVIHEIPEGLEVKVQKSTITISGIDRHAIGQFAANVRASRPPEPYKGKGIRYADEHIRRKAGKAGKAQA